MNFPLKNGQWIQSQSLRLYCIQISIAAHFFEGLRRKPSFMIICPIRKSPFEGQSEKRNVQSVANPTLKTLLKGQLQNLILDASSNEHTEQKKAKIHFMKEVEIDKINAKFTSSGVRMD